MGSVVTMRSSQWATVLIAACIVVPQLIVAALSPWVGSRAQIWGRRPLLLIGFAALPIRGLLFASVSNPLLLVVVQLLDGITAAVFAVMVPLVVADLTRGTGHLQSRPGHRRHRDRHRRVASAPRSPATSPTASAVRLGFRRLGRNRACRPDGTVAADAGDPAGRNELLRRRATTPARRQRPAEMRRQAVGQVAIDGEIILRHAARGEVFLEVCRIFSRDKWPSRSTAPMAPLTSSTMNPVRPSSITSGTEPRLNAMTGVPQAMASIITRPNGSGQSIGTSSATRAAQELGFVLVVDLADIFDIGRLDHRLDLLVVIILVGAVDLGGDLERHAAMLGDADGAIDALFRRDAAEKGEIDWA